jgi:hypothetical protein
MSTQLTFKCRDVKDEGGRSVLSDTSFWRYFKVHLATILQMVCRYRQNHKFLRHKISSGYSDCIFLNDSRTEEKLMNQNLYFSPNVTKISKSRKRRWHTWGICEVHKKLTLKTERQQMLGRSMRRSAYEV